MIRRLRNLPRSIRYIGLALLGLLVLVTSTLLLWPFLTAGPLVTSVEVRQVVANPPSVNVRGALRVITLNLAHGRGDGLHQMLLSKAAIRRNLDRVAAVLERDPALIVGVQEADTHSFWSGRFNHVEHLAQTAGFSQFAVGLQVQGMGLNYGVGVLSRIPLMEGTTYRFKARGLTANKGFVVCTFQWPGSEFSEVDFVVLHLDHLRSSTRTRQLEEVSVALKKRASANSATRYSRDSLQLSAEESPYKTAKRRRAVPQLSNPVRRPRRDRTKQVSTQGSR